MRWSDVKRQIEGINDHYSMREDQHELLYKYAKKVKRGGIVLELGVCHGKTAAMLALVGMEKEYNYFGIDDFSLEGTKAEVDAHLKRLGTDGVIIESRTQDAYWSLPVDLLFVDGGHDEVNVKADCEKYVPFVKLGGIVIFDDWPQSSDDPHWAVGQYGAIATAGWELLEDRIYMRVYRRPKW